MKKLFTLLLTCTISLSLMGQQDIEELRKQRYEKRQHQTLTALEKKKAKHPAYASRDWSRQASSIRSSALKALEATDQKMDSLLWELYDADHSEWWLSDRELFTYDENGNMTTYVWFAYDTEDMEILPYVKEKVTYNEQDQVTEILWQIWDKESGQWINDGKIEYSYNAEGDLIEQLWSYWDKDSAKWVLSSKDEFLYEEGKLTSWNTYFMEEGEWVMYFRTTYTYDVKGNLIQDLTEFFDPDMEMWREDSNYLYTYNDNDLLILKEVWEYSDTYFTLMPTWQYEYTWDSDGNLIEQVDKSWEQGVVKDTEEWLNAFKSEWSFNKEYTFEDLYVPYWFLQSADDINFVHMPVSELGYVYVDEDWAYDFRQTAYYSDFGGSTGIDEIEESGLSVYPIPASGTLTFSWEDQFTRLNLELYDLTGKRVISRSIENNEAIGIDQLSGGLYLYKLSNGKALIHSGKISVK